MESHNQKRSANKDNSANGKKKIMTQKEIETMEEILEDIHEFHEKIVELEKIEVDFDNERNSSFLELHKYKKKLIELYRRGCEIKGIKADAGRPFMMNKNFIITGNEFVDRIINHCINEDHFNIPHFGEILECVRYCNKALNLEMSKSVEKSYVWYEPTDVKKACKIFESHPEWQQVLHFVSPNVKELFAMAEYFSIEKSDKIPLDGGKELIMKVAEKLGEHVPVVITTMGAEGVLIVREASDNDPFYPKNAINTLSLIENGCRQSRLYPPLLKIDENPKDNSVSGCGDCLAAGIISGIFQGLPEEACVNLGLKAAELSLKSLETVPRTLETLRFSLNITAKNGDMPILQRILRAAQKD